MFGTSTVHWELKGDMVIGRKGKVVEKNTEADSPIPNSETIALSEYHSQELPLSEFSGTMYVCSSHCEEQE